MCLRFRSRIYDERVFGTAVLIYSITTVTRYPPSGMLRQHRSFNIPTVETCGEEFNAFLFPVPW